MSRDIEVDDAPAIRLDKDEDEDDLASQLIRIFDLTFQVKQLILAILDRKIGL